MSSAPVKVPVRRIKVTDPSQLPKDLGVTPGGTLFGTTPGGTRIIYDQAFLLKCRESPVSQMVPENLPYIPGVTDVHNQTEVETIQEETVESVTKDEKVTNDTEFAMDM